MEKLEPVKMKVYTVIDYTGEKTKHLAVSKEAAIQAHLVHYGLFYLKKEPAVDEGKDLSEFKDRSEICWDVYCCLAGASKGKFEGQKGQIAENRAPMNTVCSKCGRIYCDCETKY